MSPDTPPPASPKTSGRDNRKGGRPEGDTPKGKPSVDEIAALIASIVVGGCRQEFRLTYRRQGWQKPSTKIFQTEMGAVRYARRLQRRSDPSLASLNLLYVEARPVGPWLPVISLIDEKGGQP